MEAILVVTPTRELPPQVLPTLPDSGQVLLSSKLLSDWMTHQTNIHYFSFHANQGSPTTSTRGLTTCLIAEGFLCNLYCLYFHCGWPSTTRREQSQGDINPWSKTSVSITVNGNVCDILNIEYFQLKLHQIFKISANGDNWLMMEKIIEECLQVSFV